MMDCNWLVRVCNQKLAKLIDEAKADFADDPVEMEAEIKRLAMMDMKQIEQEFKGLGLSL